MIKVGIIGCGRILPNHLHAYKLLMDKGVDVRITAMCDISLEYAKRYWKRGAGIQPFKTGGPVGDPLDAPPIYLYDFQKDVDVGFYDDYKKMLKEADVDSVDIYTSVYTHHSIALACLEGGKHVMVEKPMAITVKAARKMVETAQKVGKKLGVAESLRYNPNIRMAKWAIDKGYIGDLQMTISGHVGGYWSPDKIVAKTAWRHKKLLAGGGATVDVGVHLLDVLRYLCGEIDEMSGITDIVQKVRTTKDENGEIIEEVECDVDDTWTATMKFKSGVFGHLHWSWSGPIESVDVPFFTVYGTKGCIKGGSEIILNDGTKTQLGPLFDVAATTLEKEKFFPLGIRDPPVGPMALETLDFLMGIKNGQDMETNGVEGWKDLAAAYAILESSKRKTTVKVKDVETGKLSSYEDEINAYHKI